MGSRSDPVGDGLAELPVRVVVRVTPSAGILGGRILIGVTGCEMVYAVNISACACNPDGGLAPLMGVAGRR